MSFLSLRINQNCQIKLFLLLLTNIEYQTTNNKSLNSTLFINNSVYLKPAHRPSTNKYKFTEHTYIKSTVIYTHFTNINIKTTVVSRFKYFILVGLVSRWLKVLDIRQQCVEKHGSRTLTQQIMTYRYMTRDKVANIIKQHC